MAITFTPTTNIKEVNVEGYGVVRIRPYGAGEELQISKNLRELDGLQKQAQSFLDTLKKDYAGDEAQIPEEQKDKFTQIQRKVEKLSNELNELIRGTISSNEPGVADRVFNELPLEQIRKIIAAAKKDEDAEA